MYVCFGSLSSVVSIVLDFMMGDVKIESTDFMIGDVKMTFFEGAL